MSYVPCDPTLPTDFALDLEKLDLSLMEETYEIEIPRQIRTDLQECSEPGWQIDEVEYKRLELRPVICPHCHADTGAKQIYIVDAQSEGATFDEDAAREYYEGDDAA